KFWPLEKADLKAITVVADPNACSQRNNTLAWFWCINIQGDSASNDWMNEYMLIAYVLLQSLY
ncbi:hypothetical protein BDR04DRAFT_946825, partial [Suillus decipiens]